MPYIKPNKIKVARDTLIIDALVVVSVFLTAGMNSRGASFLIPFLFVLSAINMFIMGVLPYLRITTSGALEYRSDYGIKHTIQLSDISKITKGSGVGGYEHALFVYFGRRPEQERRIKIKSSYFNPEHIRELMAQIKRVVHVETNRELEEFLTSK